MKATIEFDTSNLEEEQELKRMLKARDLAVVLSEIKEYLRTKEKYYDPDAYKGDIEDMLGEVRQAISDIIYEANINLDDLLM